MNDVGLDEPISSAAERFEVEQELEKQEEEDELHLLKKRSGVLLKMTSQWLILRCFSRWWFASTCSPLIAGTIGPMASSFSCCALVQTWREHIPSGATEGHGIYVPDPAWLYAVNAISLACALVANFALSLNMARRLRFSIAQPISIAGFFVASFMLIVLVATASTALRLSPSEEYALTQAFYYAIMAAALYFIIALLLLFTVWGAYSGHYEKTFSLTMAQRTLMLQTVSFMVYLLVGAAVYSSFEDWEYLDALYFADFTLLTVGIGGSYTPMTDAGKAFLFPYAIGGVVTLGLVVGSIRTLVLERGRDQIGARLVEKKRQKVLSDADKLNDILGTSTSRQSSPSGKNEGKQILNETQRRKAEFQLMRQIQKGAEKQQRWVALSISSTAAFALWLVGAVVFMVGEVDQGWSYFNCLYFSYTSLLSIGYGDYEPMSNSAKPFFVFWSLLAVPTLTILISNMGNTIVKGIEDFTIWIGNLTILPEEEGFAKTFKVAIARATGGKFFGEEKLSKVDSKTSGSTPAQLAEIEIWELKGFNDEELRLRQDIRYYHYLLVRAIRAVTADLVASPLREYSWEEWAYYLRLLGCAEDDSDNHEVPCATSHSNPLQSPCCGKAQSAGYSTMSKWSWVSHRSPLMSTKTEAEWLVDRLSAMLERELRLQEDGVRVAGKRQMPPPIRLSEIRRERDGKRPENGEMAGSG